MGDGVNEHCDGLGKWEKIRVELHQDPGHKIIQAHPLRELPKDHFMPDRLVEMDGILFVFIPNIKK